jgi:hypothetical protein
MPAYKKNYARQPAKKTLTEAQVKRMISQATAPKKRVYRKKYTRKPSYGSMIGGSIGSTLGGMVSKWMGAGDYSVKQNVLIKPSSVPIMHSADSSVRITHKEFITDITATTDFSNQSFPINPGLSSTFPYLSGIAQNFEQYRILGMVFTFKSTSADSLNSTNTALGSMLLATDYNALDSPYVTKAGFLASTFSNSGKPASDILHPIECDTSISSGPAQRYIRAGTNTDGIGDLRLYDWGNFQIGSVGQQASSVVGELWVSYAVELINPQLTIPRGLNLFNSFDQPTPAGVNNAKPFGSAGEVYIGGDTLGLQMIDNFITLPQGTAGNYLIGASYFGSANTPVGGGATPGVITLTNANPLFIFRGAGGLKVSETIHQNFAVGTMTWQKAISVVDPQKKITLTFSSPNLPTGIVSANIYCVKINGNINGLTKSGTL